MAKLSRKVWQYILQHIEIMAVKHPTTEKVRVSVQCLPFFSMSDKEFNERFIDVTEELKEDKN